MKSFDNLLQQLHVNVYEFILNIPQKPDSAKWTVQVGFNHNDK